MPHGDRKGPRGQGPRTGRGMGKCGSKDGIPASQGQGGMGAGNGQGRGLSRGTGRGTSRRGGQGSGKGRGRRP